MESKLTIKEIAHQSPEYEEAVEFRRKILRIPLGLDLTKEELDKEVSDMHYAGFLDGQLVAGAILSKLNDDEIKMRQVFVDENKQGKGLGTELVKALEALSKEKGFKTMVIQPRKSAVGFYEKLGFIIEGDEYMANGIPHNKLTKKL